jgi:lysophospholipase L1-like esterase
LRKLKRHRRLTCAREISSRFWGIPSPSSGATPPSSRRTSSPASPSRRCGAFQFGWSGDVLANITPRVENDVIRFTPEIATICYGMNDGAYRVFDPERAETYRAGLKLLVQKLKAGKARRIIIGTPGAVDITTFKRTDPPVYNDTLRRFGEIGRAVAKEEGRRVRRPAHADARIGNAGQGDDRQGFHDRQPRRLPPQLGRLDGDGVRLPQDDRRAAGDRNNQRRLQIRLRRRDRRPYREVRQGRAHRDREHALRVLLLR